MSYTDNHSLPKGVQHKLPQHAQTIYRETYNHAWEFYKRPSKSKLPKTREATAHSVAWAAVENKYKQNEEGEWVEI
jgi:cation transport regulator